MTLHYSKVTEVETGTALRKKGNLKNTAIVRVRA